MRKINKLGKRAAAMALAVGLTLSTVPPVLAVDADEVQAPAAQTEQQEEAEELPAEPDADSEEPADSDKGVELPADADGRLPVVVDPDQLPADSGSKEEASSSETEVPAADGDVDTYKFHLWYKDHTVAPTCTAKGYTHYKCRLCSDTKDEDWTDPIPHKYTTYTVTEEATEAKDGLRVAKCDYGCGNEDKQIVHYYGEWEVTKEPTCSVKGEKKHTCVNCGVEETAEIETLPHTPDEYVNDNKPACQQQTATAHCTVCGAAVTKNLPNLGSDGNPLPHKHSSYDTVYDDVTHKIPLRYTSVCDYCGGDLQKHDLTDSDALADKATDTALRNVKLDGKTADEYVDAVVNQALANAQTAVKNAKTKEEAIAALDQISITVKSELSKVKITVAGVGGDVTIGEDDLNNALKSLDDTVADLKDSLNDSFLSQDTITNVVDKLAGDVQDSSAPQTGVKKILHNTIYGAITGKNTDADNTQAINSMVLQLVKEVVKSDEGWDDLTASLVDDALDLAVDELMKDETYAKLLQTKLGAATLDDLKVEIKKQLAEDPTFMNNVRGIASKAASNAQTRVDGGWPEDKVMEGLQADLLPDVANLVSDKINDLGVSAGDVVDSKVSDTVHKFLPGKLGDWVSDKISDKANDAVQGKVNDLNKQVTDLISSAIKQFTCGTHNEDTVEIVAAKCTEDGKKIYKCSKCGKVMKTEKIDATGHTAVEDAAVEPTETSTGLTEGSHCSTCGAVLTAQEVIPMLDPTIDTWFSRAATTEADAKAAGYDSVEAANAALDAAIAAAGFDPANAEHFTVQVNSSIGVLPNDRFPGEGVTGKLTLPEGTRGKTAQTYYVVQMFTADTGAHRRGDVVVTPVTVDNYSKTGLKFTVYTEAIMGIAWKAE